MHSAMALVLTTSCQLIALQRHGEKTYPEECCGLLLGVCQRRDDGFDNIVLKVLPAANVWNQSFRAQGSEQAGSSEDSRYAIDAIAMVKAQQYARGKGWDIIGIYHSHPDQLAVPSKWDRAWAWPQYSYVIVSVQNGTAHDLQSWTLDMHHKFLPEKLVVSGATDPQVTPNLEDSTQIFDLDTIALLKDNRNAQSKSG
jgi:proteasome lid subunit RPN8/RPN11